MRTLAQTHIQGGLEIGHVARDLGAHIGIDHRGLGAFVLLHLWRHIRGHGDRRVRKHRAGHGQGAPLVLRVDVGVDKTDGESFDSAARAQRLQVAAQRVFVQRGDHRAVGADALRGADGQFQRRQQGAFNIADPAPQPAGTERARHLQGVFVTGGGDQGDPRPAAGEHGVGGDRGAVHHTGDLRGADPGFRADALDALEHADGGVLGCRGHLGRVRHPAVFVEQQAIGKGSTDIHAQSVTHALFSKLYLRLSASRRGGGHAGGAALYPASLVRLSQFTPPECAATHRRGRPAPGRAARRSGAPRPAARASPRRSRNPGARRA